MATNLIVCEIDQDVIAKFKKFRFRKGETNAAIVLKIDMDTRTVIVDPDMDEEELQDISLDDLGQELPAHQPRYVAYSYRRKHDDGRISYPLCFIFISPLGCKPELQMMYAGSKLSVIDAGGFTKAFELRSTEELTEEWLVEKLQFFR